MTTQAKTPINTGQTHQTERSDSRANAPAGPYREARPTMLILPRSLPEFSRIYGPKKSEILRFLYCGAILTLYAYGLNVLLVEWFHLYKPLSYGIVILSQTAFGFLLNRFHVFTKGAFNAPSQFLQYLMAAILFRVGDWMCFTIQVELLSIFYIYAQAFSSAIIVVAKYVVYRRIFDAEIPKSA